MPEVKVGLQNVVIATSEISAIDGQEGTLVYRGYDIHDLVEHSTFEEVVYLLWYGRLPKAEELEEFEDQLAGNRSVPPKILNLLEHFPLSQPPMDVLRTAVSALSLYDPDAHDMSPEANGRKALRLTAQMSTLVAAFGRIRQGKQSLYIRA
ncbi:MAG: citrate/2-methylcitrate synthase [Terriglobia bacterium]